MYALSSDFENMNGCYTVPYMGAIKRWMPSGRTGQFGYVGVPGSKTEYFVHEDSLATTIFLSLVDSRPLLIVFDSQVTEDLWKPDRAVNIRLSKIHLLLVTTETWQNNIQ